jgi:hypothetical protein
VLSLLAPACVQDEAWIDSHKLRVYVENGPASVRAPLKQLWVTTDGAATWRRIEEAGIERRGLVETDAEAYARVRVPHDGRYGFFWQTGSSQEAMTPAPEPGTWPPGVFRVVVDTPEEHVEPAVVEPTEPEPPSPVLTPMVVSPKGGESWTGGHSVLIKWMTPGAIGRTAVIEYRDAADGSWRRIAEERDDTGFTFWVVPDIESHHVQVRVTVTAPGGLARTSVPSPLIAIRPGPKADIAAAQEAFLRAEGMIARDKPAEAVVHLEEALRHWHNYPAALSALGAAYDALGEPEAALRHYMDAKTAEPSEARHHYNVGHAMVRIHRADEAVPHLADAVRLMTKPDAALAVRLGELLMIVARACRDAGAPEKAVAACEWVLKIPGATRAHREEARAMIEGLTKP